MASETEVAIEATQSRWVPVRLQVPYGSSEGGSHPIEFVIDDLDSGEKVTEKAVFLVPR